MCKSQSITGIRTQVIFITVFYSKVYGPAAMCRSWKTTALGPREGCSIQSWKGILKASGYVRHPWTKAWAPRAVKTSPLPGEFWKGVAKWIESPQTQGFEIIAKHSTTQSLSFRDQRIFGRWIKMILGNLRGVTSVFHVQFTNPHEIPYSQVFRVPVCFLHELRCHQDFEAPHSKAGEPGTWYIFWSQKVTLLLETGAKSSEPPSGQPRCCAAGIFLGHRFKPCGSRNWDSLISRYLLVRTRVSTLENFPLNPGQTTQKHQRWPARDHGVKMVLLWRHLSICIMQCTIICR